MTSPNLQPGVLTTQAPSQTAHSLARFTRYTEYRDFYLGYHWLGKPLPGAVRLTLNYARVFVNKAASYLMSKPVGYNATPLDADPADPASLQAARTVEDYLTAVSDFNVLPQLDLDTAISAGTLGDGAFTVRWDKSARLPKVTAVDPAGLEAMWRADDLRSLTWVRQSYWITPAELPPDQRALLGPNVDPYAPLRAQEEWWPTHWRLTIRDIRLAGGPNPYKTIPYVIFPNLRVPGEFWGESDLVDLLDLNRELNQRLSVFARILQISGYPVTVIEGATAEETADLKLGENQLWNIPEGAKAYVLDLLKTGGHTAHIEYIQAIYRALHDISEMPRTSFGDSSNQGMARSGVALEIELQPLLHKLARKQAIWSSALKRRADLILQVARLHGVNLPPVQLQVLWPPVLPQDRAALVTQEIALVGAGIHPPTKAIEVLNDPDPERLFQRVLDEAARLQQSGFGVAGALSPGCPPEVPLFTGAAGSGGGIVKDE